MTGIIQLVIVVLIITGIYLSFTVDREKVYKRRDADEDWFF